MPSFKFLAIVGWEMSRGEEACMKSRSLVKALSISQSSLFQARPIEEKAP